MPIIKYRDAIEQAMKKSVFSTSDLHAEGITENYAKKLLYMISKKKRITRIERGKYTAFDDPVIIASHITEPCYLSLWTAMSIRNLTAQIPFAVEVMTSRRRFNRELDFLGTRIMFYTIEPQMMFGYENIVWKENIRIAVAKTEKIIIDAIHIDSIPEDEIKRMISVCDKSLLEKYAKLTGNKQIIKRVGGLIKC
ncbi:MAG: hypothetical protein HZB65_04670 [Candidatus Aenigmarchaeota archaeon]|nr:hypothetical protein [Candidatus Aenigmarchaeota archaeon]